MDDQVITSPQAAFSALLTGGPLLLVPVILVLLLILAKGRQQLKLRETALRRMDDQLALYRRVMNTHAMVNISTASGEIIYANDTLAEATGYDAAELIGCRFRDFLLADPGDLPEPLLAKLHAGETWAGETKIRRKDGSVIWTRSTIVPVLDANRTLVQTIALRTDITESKLLQAEFQERAMIDRLRDEVYVFATDTLELLYMNKRSRASTNWHVKDITGKRLVDVLDSFDEDDFRTRVAPLLSGQEKSVLYEADWRGGPVEINLQLEHSLEGTPRFIAVVRDISKRKRAEQKKAEFVATVSHELRSPLTSVKGSLNLVTSGVGGPLPERAAHLIHVAQRNVDRLLRLINNLLDLEKLDANMMELTFKPHDLVAVAEEAIAANAGYGHEYGVKLRYLGDRNPVLANIDRDGMLQVLTNLLSNAVKFSPRGQWVDLTVTEIVDGVRLAVTDRGDGIPSEAHHTLFARFVQAHAQIDRQRVGTGLGLSIVKSIVEKHAGRIWFTSEIGIGTTFYIDLPKVVRLSAAA